MNEGFLLSGVLGVDCEEASVHCVPMSAFHYELNKRVAHTTLTQTPLPSPHFTEKGACLGADRLFVLRQNVSEGIGKQT